MKIEQVQNCSFKEWYSAYKSITVNSTVLDLSDEFISYLKSDGVILPQGCEVPQQNDAHDDHDDSSSETEWENEETPVAEAPSFPALDEAITQSIQNLGGAVFPKLNWSSPKDAGWISFHNSLKCTCPADVYLLLKSSEFISHDISDPYEYCEDKPVQGGEDVKYNLVLRKWIDIHPAYEFRCFVKNHEIIGISQRHPRSYYHFIKSEKEDIVEDLGVFFSKYLQETFPDPDYVVDVIREGKGKIILLDCNPWGPVTDSLLYSWEELENIQSEEENKEDEEPDLRCVESDKTVLTNPYNIYSIPKEVVDFTATADANALSDFVKLQIQAQNEETDSEGEQL